MTQQRLFFCLFFSLSFFISPNFIKGNNEEIFQQANEAYMSKKYAEAIVLYEKIANGGNEGAMLYYNLGNAYYKNGKLGQSILWYERALRLAPQNKDIQHNLAFVNQKLIDKIDPIPTLLVVQWWRTTSQLLSVRGWAIATIVASFMLIFSVILFLVLKKRWMRSLALTMTFLSFFLLFFSSFFAIKEKNRIEKNPDAIIMSHVIHVKSTPDNTSGDLFVIHEGLKVQITDKINEWVEIQIPNGEKGWIPLSSIEII